MHFEELNGKISRHDESIKLDIPWKTIETRFSEIVGINIGSEHQKQSCYFFIYRLNTNKTIDIRSVLKLCHRGPIDSSYVFWLQISFLWFYIFAFSSRKICFIFKYFYMIFKKFIRFFYYAPVCNSSSKSGYLQCTI